MKLLVDRYGRFPSWLQRLLKYGLALLAILLLAAGVLAARVFHDLPDVTRLADPGMRLTIDVRDWDGETHPFVVGPGNPFWTPLEQIPDELKWAVIAAEDASFYQHRGIDVQALKEALIYDLKRKRLARGASTITQQLAKNLYLSREKSILRKLRELVIAIRIEQELTKGRILELYLNVVELGPLVYGVGHGAEYHFGWPVRMLTPAESAFLAAILPGPRVAFNPEKRPERVRERAARLIRLLGVRKVLTDEQIAEALADLAQLGASRPGFETDPKPDQEPDQEPGRDSQLISSPEEADEPPEN